jgi:DNA replication and repair protein RecF
MPFLSLTLFNFRNLQNNTIDLLSREVYFIGENGQGKSNLLEALYYSAYGTSFRTHSDSDIVRYGEKDFSVKAFFQNDNGNAHSILVVSKNGKKNIEKNGKKIHDRKELINTMPCVLFNHDDLVFAEGEPENRRFFLDQSLSMYDVLYIDIMRRYKKILKSRNQCLRDEKYEMLDVFDKQLITDGIEMQKRRKKTVFEFNQVFGQLYEEVSGIDGVRISYEPSWKEIKDDMASRIPTCEEVADSMMKKRESDKILKTTLTGPHRDKINFIRKNDLFIPSASTGQRRLISLILRVAQAVLFTRITGEKPVLLMDDVLLELDPDKRQKFTAILPEYNQLFCTFLPGEPYERYKHTDTKIFFIQEGTWNEQRL